MYLFLLVLWVVFNESLNIEVLLVGIFVCTGLYWFMCRYLGYSVKKELSYIYKLPVVIKFIVVLIKEIIKANISVAWIVVFNKKNINPIIINFKPDIKGKSKQVLFANCITLMPGTYTILIKSGVYRVYCLNDRFAKKLENSVFVNILKEFE